MKTSEKSGSALIVVLWVLGLLALLVSSFVFDSHIEIKITSYYRNRTKAAYLAKSGMEIAELMMRKSLTAKDVAEGSPDAAEWWFIHAKRLSQGLSIRGYGQQLGEGTITVDIVTEPARRNVNLLKEDDWERVLDVGGIPREMWESLIGAFLDWTDTDDTPREHGAETEDYYAKLESPYRTKNGPLDTVGELLLVKGFTRTILYGGVLETNELNQEATSVSGIDDLLTTYGDGKVNINAASARILLTLPQVDEIIAGAIVEEREGTEDSKGKKENTSYRDVNEMFSRIPGLDPVLRNYLTTDSGIYRITCTGNVHGVTRTIWCIVRYANKQMTVLQWREEDA